MRSANWRNAFLANYCIIMIYVLGLLCDELVDDFAGLALWGSV